MHVIFIYWCACVANLVFPQASSGMRQNAYFSTIHEQGKHFTKSSESTNVLDDEKRFLKATLVRCN